jgi:aminoglycoside phosphotransferase (APT) family kinase protein
VAPDQARALIEEARPELSPVRVSHLGRGWDHDVYLANDLWVVRFPRNAMAAEAVDIELALLPWLAPQLPIPVPRPEWTGTLPVSGWHFAAYPLLPGRTIADSSLEEGVRASLARTLGQFVRVLQAIDPARLPMTLRADPLGRLDVARRLAPAVERLDALRRAGLLHADVAARLIRIIEDPPRSPPGGPAVLVHADIHRRNVLVDRAGRLTGVIDWVDVHVGSAAVDLSAAYELLPAQARHEFFQEAAAQPLHIQWARWRAVGHTAAAFAGSIDRGDAAFSEASQKALVEMSVE